MLLSDSLQSFLVLSDACSSLVLTMSSSLRSFKQRLPSPTLSLFREINYVAAPLLCCCFRPNSITLSSSRADSRAGLQSASELDSVMEFGLSGAIQLASSSRTSLSAGRCCQPICDQVRAISTCRDSSNLSATGRKPGLRPARELVCDLRASWIAG